MKKHKIVVTFTVKGKSRTVAIEVLDRLLAAMEYETSENNAEDYDQLKGYTMERRNDASRK